MIKVQSKASAYALQSACLAAAAAFCAYSENAIESMLLYENAYVGGGRPGKYAVFIKLVAVPKPARLRLGAIGGSRPESGGGEAVTTPSSRRRRPDPAPRRK